MPTRLRLGVYDALVTIETPTLVADGQGGSVLTLTPGESRWARVEQLPGVRQEGKRGQEHRYRIAFREIFEMSEHTHIIWRGQRLRVVAIRQEPGRYGVFSVECVSGRGL